MTLHLIENVLTITYKVEVNGLKIAIKLDLSSCYNLLNSEQWIQLGKLQLAKKLDLRDVSRNSIPVLGMACRVST